MTKLEFFYRDVQTGLNPPGFGTTQLRKGCGPQEGLNLTLRGKPGQGGTRTREGEVGSKEEQSARIRKSDTVDKDDNIKPAPGRAANHKRIGPDSRPRPPGGAASSVRPEENDAE